MARKERIVLILGAGASAHAGIPVLRDFLRRTLGIFEAEKLSPGSTGLGGHGSDLPDFQTVVDTWMDWRRKQWNIETFFGYVDGSRLKKISKLRVPLIWTMFRTMQICEEKHRNCVVSAFGFKYRPLEIYDKFAAQVAELRQSRDVTIVTTNQDILLDQALMRAGFRPEYHLTNQSDVNEWKGQPINLLKIHGSVNWRAAAGAHNSSQNVEVHRDPGPGNWPTGWWKERETKEYLLTPPSRKGRCAPLLSSVRQKAEDAFGHAEVLAFVGVGFPPTDDDLGDEFGQWSIRGRQKILHVWNIDDGIQQTYQRFFGNNLKGKPHWHLGRPGGSMEHFVLNEEYRMLLR